MKTKKKSSKKLSRVVIYPKDIQQLTGKSYRQSMFLHREIRAFYKKGKKQYLTIKEFAQYTGIHKKIISQFLK